MWTISSPAVTDENIDTGKLWSLHCWVVGGNYGRFLTVQTVNVSVRAEISSVLQINLSVLSPNIMLMLLSCFKNVNLRVLTVPCHYRQHPHWCVCWSWRFQVVICSYFLVHAAFAPCFWMHRCRQLLHLQVCVQWAEIIWAHLYFQLRNDCVWVYTVDTTLFAVMETFSWCQILCSVQHIADTCWSGFCYLDNIVSASCISFQKPLYQTLSFTVWILLCNDLRMFVSPPPLFFILHIEQNYHVATLIRL